MKRKKNGKTRIENLPARGFLLAKYTNSETQPIFPENNVSAKFTFEGLQIPYARLKCSAIPAKPTSQLQKNRDAPHMARLYIIIRCGLDGLRIIRHRELNEH